MATKRVTATTKPNASSKDADLVRRTISDFKRAFEYKRTWCKEAQEDANFALGEQWEAEDIEKLKKQGIRALTINKIKPKISLLLGIESQNRTDAVAYPEGGEDTLVAEIATRLLKNTNKAAQTDYKISEAFKDSVITGESYIEPYLDYTYDLLNGCMKLKKLSGTMVFPDPGAQEYDLSDGKFLCKLSLDLTKDDLLYLFPDQEKDIEAIDSRKIDTVAWSLLRFDDGVQKKGYNDSAKTPGNDLDLYQAENYDLLEYYYKKPVKKYYVIDSKLGQVKLCTDKDEAVRYVETSNEGVQAGQETARWIERTEPEIWLRSIVGATIMADVRSWSYPRWRSYPLMPVFCYRSTLPVKNTELLVQGITRNLKDINRDYNKRRTQELRIINSSANSGWISEEGAWVDKDKVSKFGSVPGVMLEYKKGAQMPTRIESPVYPVAIAQMASERTQEIKEASGINDDQIGMNERQASGKAIHLRQQQGLVMVQEVYDNLSQSKKLIGKFMLTQLGELYTVETALQVLGESFIQENFQAPVMQTVQDPVTQQPIQVPVIDPNTQQPRMQVDMKSAQEAVNKVLNDTQLGKYDITIAEGANNATVKINNYYQLSDMMSQGMAIPPEVLLEESSISNASKIKIQSAIQQQVMAAAAAQPKAKKK